MSEETKHLFCARDRVRAETYGNEGGPTRIKCPTCGQEDDFREAVGEAMKAQVGNLLGSALSSSKNIKISSSGAPARWYLADD